MHPARAMGGAIVNEPPMAAAGSLAHRLHAYSCAAAGGGGASVIAPSGPIRQLRPHDEAPMVAAARVVRTPREVLPLREVPPVLPQPPAHLRTTEPPKRLATVELGGAAPLVRVEAVLLDVVVITRRDALEWAGGRQEQVLVALVV